MAKPTKQALQVLREDRRREAYRRWVKNMPVREIASELGCGVATAWRAIQAYREAIQQTDMASAERYRDKQREQHEANQRDLAENHDRLLAIAGSSVASLQVQVMALEAAAKTKAEHTRSLVEVSKLTGTQMPIKVASTTPDGAQWAPLALKLASIPTDELKIIKKYKEMSVLGEAEPMNAQVIDAEVVKTGAK